MSGIYLDPDLEAKFLSEKTGCTIQQGLDFYDAESEFLEITEKENIKVLDEQKLLDYITKHTNIPRKLIEEMYFAEEEYFIKIGIIELDDDKKEKKPKQNKSSSKKAITKDSPKIDKQLKTLKNSGLENNKEQILYTLKKKQPEEFTYIDKSLKNDRDFLLDIAKVNGLCLGYFAPKFKDDDEIVFAAVNSNRLALKYASERLRNNKQLVLLSLSQHDAQPLYHIGKELQNDEEIFYTALKATPYGFSIASAGDKIRDNREIMLEAIKRAGSNIKYASKRLKNDKEIAIIAVRQDQYNFDYISNDLKNDKDVVIELLKVGDKYCFDWAGDKIKQDKEFVEKYVGKDYKGLFDFDDELFENAEPAEIIDDEDEFIKLLDEDKIAPIQASEKLHNSKRVILHIVKKRGFLPSFTNEEIRNDIEFAKQAIKLNGTAFIDFDDSIKENREMLLLALENTDDIDDIIDYWQEYYSDRDDKEIFRHIAKNLSCELTCMSDTLKNDKNFAKEILAIDGFNLLYFDYDIQNDKELVLFAIKHGQYDSYLNEEDISPIQYASEELLDDKEIIIEAIKYNPESITLASEELQKDKTILKLLK